MQDRTVVKWCNKTHNNGKPTLVNVGLYDLAVGWVPNFQSLPAVIVCPLNMLNGGTSKQ